MKFKIGRNYLFVFYHWLYDFNLNDEKYYRNNIVPFTESNKGKRVYLASYLDFIKLDFCDELLNETTHFSQTKKEKINCYFSYARDSSSGINKTIYLFEFENENIKNLIKSVSFRKDLQNILPKINKLYSKNPEINSRFSFSDTFSILYLESNLSSVESIINKENKISEFVIIFRKLIDRNYILSPFLFFNIIIDSDFLFSNHMKNFIIFGVDKLCEIEKKEILLPYGFFLFLDFASLINLLIRFDDVIKASNIFRLSISEYVEKTVNSKNISKHYKEVYLKEKLKISSSRILFLYKANRLIEDFSDSVTYTEISNMDSIYSLIDVDNSNRIPLSFKRTLWAFYKGLTNEFIDNIDLLKTKERILNEFFRDLSTITTNELNLLLQKKMKSLTILAIIITVIGIILSFKNELFNFFKTYF